MKALALVLLAACGAHPTRPAWPERHATGRDGGESLAPHRYHAIAAAAAAEDDEVTPEIAPVPAAAPAGVPLAPAAKPLPVPDEPVLPEEVIEIDD